MVPIRVLVVDDSVTIRAMLEEVLGRETDIQIVGLAADAMSAIRMVHELRPHVATLDIAMPGMDGLSLLDTIHLTTNAIMLTSRAEAAKDAIERGAMGFFVKSEILKDPRALVKMVRKAAGGKTMKPKAIEAEAPEADTAGPDAVDAEAVSG
ncbi:response regulator [Sphingomonas sp. AOB5]|uniref:response regulator n=1 Tax=Sphingomonas sp. AOB5 TaxID=3034017 RepID=UPI0023F69B85|nr:response regulator [Sphingomonas sp. AOB5]MDF7775324.1 response regulator [Sphingomonas sp. AOB5]